MAPEGPKLNWLDGNEMKRLRDTVSQVTQDTTQSPLETDLKLSFPPSPKEGSAVNVFVFAGCRGPAFHSGERWAGPLRRVCRTPHSYSPEVELALDSPPRNPLALNTPSGNPLVNSLWGNLTCLGRRHISGEGQSSGSDNEMSPDSCHIKHEA